MRLQKSVSWKDLRRRYGGFGWKCHEDSWGERRAWISWSHAEPKHKVFNDLIWWGWPQIIINTWVHNLIFGLSTTNLLATFSHKVLMVQRFTYETGHPNSRTKDKWFQRRDARICTNVTSHLTIGYFWQFALFVCRFPNQSKKQVMIYYIMLKLY